MHAFLHELIVEANLKPGSLRVLQEADVDGVLFCNEADLPYQLAVGPEIPFSATHTAWSLAAI